MGKTSYVQQKILHKPHWSEKEDARQRPEQYDIDDDIAILVDGEVIAGNAAFARNDAINFQTANGKRLLRSFRTPQLIVRDERTQQDSIYVFEVGALGSTWYRLIPRLEPEKEQCHRTPLQVSWLIFSKVFSILFVTIGVVLQLLQAACEGWTSNSRR